MFDNLRLAIARALIPSKYKLPEATASLIRAANRSGRELDLDSSIDINIDLETWGLTPGSAIRSIGAFATSLTASIHGEKTFSTYIHDKSCEAAGLTIDPGTVEWWENQSEKAKDQFHGAYKFSLEEALIGLNQWIVELVFETSHGAMSPITVHVWGNGAVMDIALIEAAYRAVNLKPAWEWWASQDCRTIERLSQQAGLDFRRSIEIEGELHVALNDAMAQGKRTSAGQESLLALVRLGKALM